MRTIIFSLVLAFGCSAQILQPIISGKSNPDLTLTATTTEASQTVTIKRLTLTTATTIYWGDTQTTALASGSTGQITHVYADAGTYSIRVPGSANVTAIDLEDAQLSNFNTLQLRSAAITYFYVTAIKTSTIRSADMVAWRPTTWYLYSMPAGTYNISSADMVAWRPTTWYLGGIPAGTYSI